MKNWMFLEGNHGGQFAPAEGGQFESATHGQFKSAEGGQIDRSLQWSRKICGIISQQESIYIG